MSMTNDIRKRFRSRDDHHPDCNKRHHMADDAVACDCYANRDCRTHEVLDNIEAALEAGKQLAEACRLRIEDHQCAQLCDGPHEGCPCWYCRCWAALAAWDELEGRNAAERDS